MHLSFCFSFLFSVVVIFLFWSSVNLIPDWINPVVSPQTTQEPSSFPSLDPSDLSPSKSNHVVHPSKSVKYLGVTISANLSWSEHIRLTCKSAKCSLGLIRHQFNHAPPTVHHKIYMSVILPKLEYCTAVWDPTSPLISLP